MGLIKSVIGSFTSTTADQWLEYYYSDALPSDVIMKRASKRVTGGSNKKGSEFVISDGSGIAVNEGQAALIIENGLIKDLAAEPGIYTFKSEHSPTIFTGGLEEGIKKSFEMFKTRFKHGGSVGQDQRVYFFNLKEMTNYKFGTGTPVVYDDPMYKTISIRFFGMTTFKLTDPILFYKNVAGNVDHEFRLQSYWEETLKSIFLMHISETMALLAKDGYKFNQLPQQQTKIAEYMNDILDEDFKATRGLEVFAVGINSISLSEEDKEKIKKIDQMYLMTDPNLKSGRLSEAYASAMENAASNEGGSMIGFAGMNYAAQAGSGVLNNISNMNNEGNQMNQMYQGVDSWQCSSCGKPSRGKFCSECGEQKPDSTSWLCKCGNTNTGKFCSECGKQKSENSSWTCKCGNINQNKFCSSCGKEKE